MWDTRRAEKMRVHHKARQTCARPAHSQCMTTVQEGPSQQSRSPPMPHMLHVYIQPSSPTRPCHDIHQTKHQRAGQRRFGKRILYATCAFRTQLDSANSYLGYVRQGCGLLRLHLLFHRPMIQRAEDGISQHNHFPPRQGWGWAVHYSLLTPVLGE